MFDAILPNHGDCCFILWNWIEFAAAVHSMGSSRDPLHRDIDSALRENHSVNRLDLLYSWWR